MFQALIRVKRNWHYIFQAIIVFSLILLTQGLVLGSELVNNPLVPPATNSPRATFTQFLENTNDAYQLITEAVEQGKNEPGLFYSKAVRAKARKAEFALERAISTLSLEDLSRTRRRRVGARSALLLKEILDRLDLPAPNEIPDEATATAEELKLWSVPNTEITLLKIEEGVNAGDYLFSSETVKNLRFFYKKVKTLPYKPHASEGFYSFYISTPGRLLPPKWSNWLPKWTQKLYGEQTLWQWVALVISLVISSALALVIGALFRSKKYSQDNVKDAWSALLFPISILIILQFELTLISDGINITYGLMEIIQEVGTGLAVILSAWISFILFNAIGRSLIQSPRFVNNLLEATIVRNGFRLLGFVASATTVYYGGQLLGIPLGPLLASLSIGSVAIGLGIQPYLKNIVGGITLFLNQPMQIGDFCEFGGVSGTVEDIGLRATLIRTSDRSLITVPNTAVSESNVVNHSRRDKYTFTYTMRLAYDNAQEHLLSVMNQLRKQLAEHPLLDDERLSLVDLNGTAVDIELCAYVLTTNLVEYKDTKEKLLISIQNTLDQLGVNKLK